MKEQLAKILGLENPTDEQIVEAVQALKKAKAPAAVNVQQSARDKAIRDKINASGGALNYEQAAMAVDHQTEAAAKKKGKAEK